MLLQLELSVYHWVTDASSTRVRWTRRRHVQVSSNDSLGILYGRVIVMHSQLLLHGVQRRMISVDICFSYFLDYYFMRCCCYL